MSVEASGGLRLANEFHIVCRVGAPITAHKVSPYIAGTEEQFGGGPERCQIPPYLTHPSLTHLIDLGLRQVRFMNECSV